MRMIEDDLIFFKFVGSLELKDSEISTDLMRTLTNSGRSLFLVCDVSELGNMEPEARRMASQWYSQNNIAGSVTFGAKWTTRALAEMVYGALRVMGKLSFPVGFVQTEAEALTWVADQRRRRATRAV